MTLYRMSRNKKIFGIIFISFIIALCFIIKKIIIYPKRKLLELDYETTYREVLWKFGSPKQIMIPFFKDGTNVENNFINIDYWETFHNNKEKYITYYLTFNSQYKLNKLGIFNSEKDKHPTWIYFDNRGPNFYKKEIEEKLQNLERVKLGQEYKTITEEFGEPDFFDSNNLYAYYFVKNNKTYKLYFSDSYKLKQFDVCENFDYNEQLQGEFSTVFFDARIK